MTRDQQFVCQGANYRQHMIESGMDPDAKKFNMIFTKSPDCIVAADSDVVMPRQVRFLDYEIELGLVLNRSVHGRKTITDSELHEYVAALVIVNDYSARDVQIPQMQFYKGKSFRTFGPVGPLGAGGLDVVQDNTLSTGFYSFATSQAGTYRVTANLATGNVYGLLAWRLYADPAFSHQVAHCFKSAGLVTSGTACTVFLPGGGNFYLKIQAVGAQSGVPGSTAIGGNDLHLAVERLGP